MVFELNQPQRDQAIGEQAAGSISVNPGLVGWTEPGETTTSKEFQNRN
jgi:hypothetical protein